MRAIDRLRLIRNSLVEAVGMATIAPAPDPGLRMRGYSDDIRVDGGTVKRETRSIPEYRWSVEVCIPSRDSCFPVRTRWYDRTTRLDKSRFLSTVKSSLHDFFRTGMGMSADRDGGFTL